MNKPKHTPTPWKYDPTWNLITADCGMIEVAACHTGERMRFKKNKGETAKANAEFIVKACNSYDDMLEALKAIFAYDWHDALDDEHGENESNEAKVLKKVRAAIVKAETGK